MPGSTSTVVNEATSPQAVQASWQQHTDPVTLTMASQITQQEDPSIPGFKPPQWGEDAVSRRIMDLTGVRIDMVATEKNASPSALLASGQLPDLFCITDEKNAYFSAFEDASVCYSLDELADQYCPDFWDNVDPLEKLSNQAADGHVYTLRSGYFDEASYSDDRVALLPPGVLALRTDTLEKLAADVPASVEELETLLYEAKRAGTEAPYSTTSLSDTPVAGWMGAPQGLTWNQDTKRIETPLQDDAWLTYLKKMAQWYRDGILLPVELGTDLPSWYEGVDTATQSFAKFVPINGFYLLKAYGSGTPTDSFPFTLIAKTLTYQGKVQLAAADQLVSHGDAGRAFATTCQGTFISRGCSAPDRAIYLLEFLKSDQGAKLARWGVEDIHYTLDDAGYPLYLDDYRSPKTMEYSGMDIEVIHQTGVNYWRFMYNSAVTGLRVSSPKAYDNNEDVIKLRQMLLECGKEYKKEAAKGKNPVFAFAWPTGGSAEDQRYQQLLKSWQQGLTAIVTASADDGAVETAWQALKQDLHDQGLDTLEDAMTVRFTDALKRYHAAGYFTDIQP